MVINGVALLAAQPIKAMLGCKATEHGVSYGLGEAGYDIRIKQEIRFSRYIDVDMQEPKQPMHHVVAPTPNGWWSWVEGKFCLASAMEEFQMPNNLVGIVHDKSTWARRGLSVFNTVIEPGWNGFLTLELVYHGEEELIIPAGAGIAQVIFSQLAEPRAYEGKYQNQENKPVAARSSV